MVENDLGWLEESSNSKKGAGVETLKAILYLQMHDFCSLHENMYYICIAHISSIYNGDFHLLKLKVRNGPLMCIKKGRIMYSNTDI